MKKKIAFLLAATMVVSAPMTAFASVKEFSPKINGITKETLFPTNSVYKGTWQKTGGSYTVKDLGVSAIASLNDSTDKEIILDSSVGYLGGDQFEYNLKNAKWFYAKDTSNSEIFINLNGSRTTYDEDEITVSNPSNEYTTGTAVKTYNTFTRNISGQVDTSSLVRNLEFDTTSNTAMTSADKLQADTDVTTAINAATAAIDAYAATDWIIDKSSYTAIGTPTKVTSAAISAAAVVDLATTRALNNGASAADNYTASIVGTHATTPFTTVAIAPTATHDLTNYTISNILAAPVAVPVGGTITAGTTTVGYTVELSNISDNAVAVLTFHVTDSDDVSKGVGKTTQDGTRIISNVKLTKKVTFIEDKSVLEAAKTGATINFVADYKTIITATNQTAKITSSSVGFKAGKVNVPLAFVTLNETNVAGTIAYTNNHVTNQRNDKLTTASKDLKLTIAKAGSGTKAYANDGVKDREKLIIKGLTIDELGIGAIGNGVYQVAVAPGYKFINDTIADVNVSADKAWAESYLIGFNYDKTIAYFNSQINSASTGSSRRYVIEGLEIERTYDYSNYNDEIVTVDVRGLVEKESYSILNLSTNVVGSPIKNNFEACISTTNLVKVGTLDYYGLLFDFENKDSKVKDSWSGLKEIVTPALILEEKATNSWWSNRDTRFTLVDADGVELDLVKIQKVAVLGTSNVRSNVINSYEHNTQVGYTSDYIFNRGFLQVTGLAKTTDINHASIKLQFTLNTAANFVGPVYVKVTGSGIDEDTVIYNRAKGESNMVQIADIKAPIKIETATTDVVVGHQTYNVKDIKVTEVAPKLIRTDKILEISVSEFANAGAATLNTDITFNPITLANVKVDATNKTSFAFGKVTIGGNKISLSVAKPSNAVNKEAVFTVSGLAVNINRSVPNGVYDLVIGGSALVDTYTNATIDEKTAMFPIAGVISEKYIAVVTPGDSKSISTNVVLTPGKAEVLVDGKETKIDPVPFIDEATGRTMIPLRAVATLLNVEEKYIVWDKVDHTATVTLPSIQGQKTVVFTEGSSSILINGVKQAMLDENGVEVKVVIDETSGRIFLPFRQLANAFGIDMDWDAVNGQVILNATPEQKVALTATTAPATTPATTPAA